MKTLIKILCLSVLWFSCGKKDIHGCLDSKACNYNSNANIDNNSCLYLNACGHCPGQDLENVVLWGECYNIETTTTLNLSANQLTGEIPPEIWKLTNLKWLYLGWNELSGEIPPEICNIYVVSVEKNKLCPPYPYCISQHEIDTQSTYNCP